MSEPKRDPGSGLSVPAHINREVPDSKASGWTVVETFFGKRPPKGYPTPGKTAGGFRLGYAGNYFNMPKDENGNDLVHGHWGGPSERQTVKNKSHGYVAAKVNENGDLDPNGREIKNGEMVLLVQPMEVKKTRDKRKTERAAEYRAKRRAADSVEELNSKAGSKVVVGNERTEQGGL